MLEPETIISRHAEVIAQVLAPGHAEATLSVECLKTSPTSSSYRVSVGEKHGLVKIFRTSESAQAAFDRERRALEGFQNLSVPKMLLVSERDLLITAEYLQGRTLTDLVSEQNVIQMAEFLGQWFGRLANISPTEASNLSWDSYLDGYEGSLSTEFLEGQRNILRKTRIRTVCLNHNDNALENFLVAKDKKLYGLDFEDCRMKPLGWDLVTGTRAFFVRFPDKLQTISNSLLRGFRLTGPKDALPDEFDQIINTIVVSNILANAQKSPEL